MDNVFSSLTRAGISSPENYLTEALVYVLKLLLARQPVAGLELINQLCELPAPLDDPNEVEILTQTSYEIGRPDIEIRALDTLVFIEVKHDSWLGPNQLESYYEKLLELNMSNSRLVFLSRSLLDAQLTTLEAEKFNHVCWYQVHGWLSDLLTVPSFKDEVCRFFAADLMSFLENKNMAIKKVTWEYMQGMPAFINMINMLETALIKVAPSGKQKKTAGWSWMGFYLDSIYFIGTRYDQPLLIAFENNIGTNPTYSRYFDMEQEHFFRFLRVSNLKRSSISCIKLLRILLQRKRNHQSHLKHFRVNNLVN
jgi:hypothetical protein